MLITLNWHEPIDFDRRDRISQALVERVEVESILVAPEGSSIVLEVRDGCDVNEMIRDLAPPPDEVQQGKVVESIGSPRTIARRPPTLGDPFAMALIQWPAIYGLFELPMEPWAHALRVLLSLWVLGTVRAGFRYSYGALHGYGVGLILNAVWALVVWRFWFEWPAWIALALGVLGLMAQLRMLGKARGARTRADLSAA